MNTPTYVVKMFTASEHNEKDWVTGKTVSRTG